MRIKGTYLMIIMLLACSVGMAQMAFRYSPIAISNGALTVSGGNPIILNGEGKCVKVSTGMSVLTIANNAKGEFGVGCKEIPPVANILTVSVSLNVYPNPTSGMTTVKCEGHFDANLSCQISVVSMGGLTMMSKMVAMKDVKAGFAINASAYAAGNYVVNINFMNQQYNMKFMKL